jgi:hypothetical protein
MNHYAQEWNRGFDQGWEEASERGYWMEFCARWSHLCTVFAACIAITEAYLDGASTVPYDRWGAHPLVKENP